MRRKKNGRRANHIGQLPEPRKACPTPGKVAYDGRKEAKALMRKLNAQGDRGRIHVYKCECGRFHLGTAAAKPSMASNQITKL